MSDLRASDRRRPMADLRADGEAVLEWAADYLEHVGERPVLAQVRPGEIRSRLPPEAPEEAHGTFKIERVERAGEH